MPTNTYGSRCRAPGGTMTTGWNRPGNSRVSDMRPIRRILVAVRDPAAGMTPAVVKAAQLARALRAELELFHGITTPLYVDAYSFSETLPQIERAACNGCGQKLEG